MITRELLARTKGGLHISTTTMLPATSQRLAALHSESGVGFVEAPVFGRPEAATAKQLAIPYPGRAADKERALPYLRALGGNALFDLGDHIGAALATKLAGNFMIVSAARTFGEALAMAKHQGADPKLVANMLTSRCSNGSRQRHRRDQRKRDDRALASRRFAVKPPERCTAQNVVAMP